MLVCMQNANVVKKYSGDDMGDHELALVAKEAARAAVNELKNGGYLHYTEEEKRIHDRQHEALEEIIDTLKRLNSVKWTVIKAVSVASVFAILALIGIKLR